MRKWRIGPFLLTGHWQNLDDDDKLDLAGDALMAALKQLNAATNEHWQEISNARLSFSDRLRGKLGLGWRNGRGWLTVYPGSDDKRSLAELHAQWLILKRQHSIGIGLDVGGGDGGDEVLFHIRLPFFGLYVSVESDLIPRSWFPKKPYKDGFLPAQRELGVDFHNGTFWFKLWSDPHDWTSEDDWRDGRSRVRQPNLDLVKLLLGKEQHDMQMLDFQHVNIQFPEGVYPATISIERVTWKRPRWPWPKVVMRGHIQMVIAPPIPGKGENAWDCEDDAVYSFTTPAEDMETVARNLILSVIESRERYGGVNWEPAAGWPIVQRSPDNGADNTEKE